jgi:hypothetical protein
MTEFEKLYLGMPIVLIIVLVVGYWIGSRWLDRIERREAGRR